MIIKTDTAINTLEETIKKIRSRFRPTIVWQWSVVGFFIGFVIILGITAIVYRYYVVSDRIHVEEEIISDQIVPVLHQDNLDKVLEILEERNDMRPVANEYIDQ
ncbi:MAG: hypothetical protein K9M36_00665 [Candidatus Pacebacteria bacterium]|nr:hypothetical protein [Candidatus Paceibacterota bacterium]